MSGLVATTLLALTACFMLLCRVDKMMKGLTKPTVFIQHSILAIGMFSSVILNFTEYSDWSGAAMSGGVVAFFMLSVGRWRQRAPDGTTKPAPLRDSDLRHVSGGKKD